MSKHIELKSEQSHPNDQWHPMAAQLGSLLKGELPDPDSVQKIRLANAPKKFHEEILAQEKPKVPVLGIEGLEPFHHHNTYKDPDTGEEVVEEWRRNHQADNQLTKVQINWRTGKVAIIKQVTEAQKRHDRKEGKAGKGDWIRRDYDLNRPNDLKRIIAEAFK